MVQLVYQFTPDRLVADTIDMKTHKKNVSKETTQNTTIVSVH